MPIEWVGESLSSAYTAGNTRPVDPLAKGPPDREEETPSKKGRSFARNPYRDTLQNRPQRFERAVYAKEIMQTRIATVTQDTPLSKVLDVVLNNNMLHIPVIQKGGKLAGMITYFNLLQSTTRQNMPLDTHAIRVMNSRVLTATGNTTLHELSRVMVMEHVDAVPILDNAQKLVGLVTTTEMMECIVHHSKLNVWI